VDQRAHPGLAWTSFGVLHAHPSTAAPSTPRASLACKASLGPPGWGGDGVWKGFHRRGFPGSEGPEAEAGWSSRFQAGCLRRTHLLAASKAAWMHKDEANACWTMKGAPLPGAGCDRGLKPCSPSRSAVGVLVVRLRARSILQHRSLPCLRAARSFPHRPSQPPSVEPIT